jgi:hypothetical protein
MSGIAILGMGRSGTTFLTESLARCGVYVGGVNWAHEHEGVRAINDELLARFCGARIGTLPYGRIREFSIPESYRRRAAEVVEQLGSGRRDSGAPYWAFKDPRTTLLHRLWLDKVDVIMGIFRHPTEVARSYIEHRFVNVPNALEVLTDYWLSFNRVLVDLCHSSECSMHLLHFNGQIEQQLRRLVERIGLAYHPTIEFKPALKHFHHADCAEESAVMGDAQVAALYARLCEISRRQFDDQRIPAPAWGRGA